MNLCLRFAILIEIRKNITMRNGHVSQKSVENSQGHFFPFPVVWWLIVQCDSSF